MKFPQTVTIAESLPYDSRIAFIAFCAERCLKEAERHPQAREQLQKLPLLKQSINMLWDRAERGVLPDPERLTEALEHVSSYETPAPDSENVLYQYDVTLVQAARVLMKGLRSLQNPEQATGRYTAGAREGPFLTAAAVYTEYKKAREAEAAITDSALLRLQESGNQPFSRAVFANIPDWERGEPSKKYAENRIRGTAEEE